MITQIWRSERRQGWVWMRTQFQEGWIAEPNRANGDEKLPAPACVGARKGGAQLQQGRAIHGQWAWQRCAPNPGEPMMRGHAQMENSSLKCSVWKRAHLNSKWELELARVKALLTHTWLSSECSLVQTDLWSEASLQHRLVRCNPRDALEGSVVLPHVQLLAAVGALVLASSWQYLIIETEGARWLRSSESSFKLGFSLWMTGWPWTRSPTLLLGPGFYICKIINPKC